MKFGKRLAAEAARCWPEACLDYKAIKRALKHDLAASDPAARTFLQQLLKELQKVSSFYVEQAEALESLLAQAAEADAALEQLSSLRGRIRQLIKFVALNYLAVVKAIKKRNRHCKAVFGAAAAGPALHPMDLLRTEVFFSSPRLAALSTQAELLEAAAAAAAVHCGSSSSPGPASTASGTAAAAAPGGAIGAAAAAAAVDVEDYQCPICLDVLRSPVVLNCTHRFCWGCLVAHCASVTGPSSTPADAAVPSQDQQSCSQHGPCSHHQQHDQKQQHGCQECPPPDADMSAAQSARSASSGSLSKRSSSGSSAGRGEGLVVLEKLVASGSVSGGSDCCAEYYSCPVCRQPTVLAVDNLAVDPQLSRFVEQLRQRLAATSSSSSSRTVTLTEQQQQQQVDDEEEDVAAAASAQQQPDSQCLLPRQLACHAGRLTVLLDLDGTLVSSFTPRRAPRLPAGMTSHLVGVGSSLNPSGVFVVERPGLTPFLQQLAAVAEVVVFTAGLEEYASPIIDAIDPTNSLISARLYRPATTRTPHHQCIKDLANLGRPLSRTVLVDDTPLAFLHQPECGIPVLPFKGDPDDRLLMEAVLPLCQTLASAPDVRVMLERRFDMKNWFRRHGYPESIWQPRGAQQPDVGHSASVAASHACHAAPADLHVIIEEAEPAPVLLLCDFDKTLTDWDAGERITSELAPELVPWLASLDQPANFVPVTNEVLREMARRGVSRDKLLTCLQLLGAELPGGSVRLLRAAKAAGVPVKVLSDCNSVFISHILRGARLHDHVDEVITNAASFEKVAAADVDDAGIGLGVGSGSSKAPAGACYRLVIQPRHPEAAPPHGCPRCPANLCKGEELARLRFGGQQQQQGSGAYSRIVYAGDGANDVCPALSLGPQDVVLARAGHALAAYAAAAAQDSSLPQIVARVCLFETHEQLAQLVKQHTAAGSKSSQQ